MAGVKGRSGGARPGAGRTPKQQAKSAEVDPLAFLHAVMRGEIDATALQVRAAIAAAQYVHTKRADGGKKEEAAGKAKELTASGRLATRSGPRLAVSNG